MAIDIEEKAKEMADKSMQSYQENLADAMETFETLYHCFFVAGTKARDFAKLYNDVNVIEVINDLLSSAYDIGRGEYDEA